MACSFCKEKGHTVKTCPKKRDEVLKVQRSRINMFIQILPAIMNNPIFQALLWWQISKRNRVLDFTNKLIVAQEATGLLELGGASFMADVNPVDLPEGVVLGAIIQEVEDTAEFLEWSAGKTKAIIDKIEEAGKDVYDAGVSTKEQIEQHGYETGSSDWVRYLEEGAKYFWKYGELPP